MFKLSSFLTQAVESVDGKGVARVASTTVRAIAVDTNLFTKMTIFVTFMDF